MYAHIHEYWQINPFQGIEQTRARQINVQKKRKKKKKKNCVYTIFRQIRQKLFLATFRVDR